jgi:hypothetical protein
MLIFIGTAGFLGLGLLSKQSALNRSWRKFLNLSVRKADLEVDKHVIIETLFHHLTSDSNEVRFDWLYNKNPFGPALTWLGVDKENETIFGVASAFPRRVFINGKIEDGWVLGDFCIHKQYRSLGPGIQLQRACLADIESRNSGMWYDFPNSSMMAIYQRLRVPFPKIHVLRLAKPIRVDRKVSAYIMVPFLVVGATSTANFVLKRLQRAKSLKQKGVTVDVYEDECGTEFTQLASKVGQKQDVCLERSATYLNWRYVRNPLCRYLLITARRGPSLRAYAVYHCTEEDMTVVDIFGYEDVTVIQALLDYVTERSRVQGIMTLSIPLVENHPWRPLLQQLGFQVREASPFVLQILPGMPNAIRNEDAGGRWFMVEGDRDG